MLFFPQNGNDIDLNVAQSRFIVQRSHEAYRGSDESGELIFLEVIFFQMLNYLFLAYS